MAKLSIRALQAQGMDISDILRHLRSQGLWDAQAQAYVMPDESDICLDALADLAEPDESDILLETLKAL